MPDLRGPARGIMTIRLVRQARRLATLVIGFLFLAIGLVLAALPVIPGGVVGILAGLAILSTELEWARRLRTRMLAGGQAATEKGLSGPRACILDRNRLFKWR
jgi:hypothetical protein